MKTNTVLYRILPSAILIILLISNLSLTARNKPFPYSAADIILPALQTEKTMLRAELIGRKGIHHSMKQEILNPSNYRNILKKELIEKMDVMNPGNGNPSNEYKILIK